MSTPSFHRYKNQRKIIEPRNVVNFNLQKNFSIDNKLHKQFSPFLRRQKEQDTSIDTSLIQHSFLKKLEKDISGNHPLKINRQLEQKRNL